MAAFRLLPVCLLSSLVLACTAPAPGGSQGGAPIDDTGEAPGTGGEGEQGRCIPDDARFEGISASKPGTVGSVVRVSWQAPGSSQGWVRYTDSLGQERDVPVDAEGGATLRGLLPDAGIEYRVVAEIDGELWCSSPQAAWTTPLPLGLPEARLWLSDEKPVAPGFFATSVMTVDRRFAVVLDTAGNIVWAWEPPADRSVGSPLYRVAFSRDGESILVNTHAMPGDPGTIWRVSWDGEQVEEIRLDNIHRDFVELADGTLAVLGWETRRTEEMRLVRGDVVMEIRPGGEVRQAWNIFEDYDHDLGPTEVMDFIDAMGVHEWAHANALHYDPVTDTYILSLPEVGDETLGPAASLVAVDRSTGAQRWELSAQRGDFAIPEGEPMLEFPHSVQPVEDGLLIFNRGTPESCSRATEIALDPQAGEAWTRWESSSNHCIHVVFLGEARRLADGNTAVMYSSGGQLDIVDPDGRPIFELQLDLGAGFGFLDLRDRLYGDTAE